MAEAKQRSLILAVVACLAVWAFLPSQSQAVITVNWASPTLTITLSETAGTENVTVAASGADISVTGSGAFSQTVTGAVGLVTTINITCGIAINTVDLSGVTVAAGFSALTQTNSNLANGSGGTQVFLGSDKKDVVTGGGQADSITGNDGNDTVTGLGGIDIINGNDGDDDLDGGGASNTLNGGNGNDTLKAGIGNINNQNQILNGDADDDTYVILLCTYTSGLRTDTITDTGGNDTIYYDVYPKMKSDVTDSGSQLSISPGNYMPVIYPAGGIETKIIRPSFTFNAGLLTVLQWSGNTSCTAVGGNVKVNMYDPEGGATVLASAIQQIAVTYDDTPFGASKNVCDLHYVAGPDFSGLDNKVTVTLGGSDDITSGTAFADTFIGGTGNDTIFGQGGADMITSNEGGDKLFGEDGDDVLSGNAGTDTLNGGAGNDTFFYYLNDGTDTMNGGDGDDAFNIQAPAVGTAITINGNEPAVLLGDQINYDAMGKMAVDTPTGTGSGHIGPSAQVGTVNYTTIEQVNMGGAATLPEIAAAPSPMDTGAALMTTGTSTLTVSNAGAGVLNVTRVRVLAESVAGAFSLVGGDITTTQSLGAFGSSTSTLPVGIQFYNTTVGVVDAPATAILEILSDSGGVPDTVTTVSLNGYSANVFTWSGATASWDDASSWIPNAVPAREDTAIVHSGKVTRTRALVVDANYATRNDAVTSLSLTGGHIEIQNVGGNRNFTVGNNTVGGSAHFIQEGGFISTSNTVQTGLGAGARGIYDMRDGAILAANLFQVGQTGGIGEFNMTRGSIDVAKNFVLGNAQPSSGTFTMADGAVTGNQDVIVGNTADAYGALSQSGGTFRASGFLTLGNVAGANGTCQINDGSLTVGADARVGYGGKGSLTIGGGACAIAGQLAIGAQASGSGAFDMSSGALLAGQIAGGPGAMAGWTWTGGAIQTSTVSLPIGMTNGGGQLTPGGAGVGTTVLTPGTTYTQTAGALEFDIADVGSADQVQAGAAFNLNGGDIVVRQLGGEPSSSGSWDIVKAFGAGQVNVSNVAVNLPASNWSVTSDAARITVHFSKPATLDAPTTVTFPTIVLSRGDTVSTKTFEIGNVGDTDLVIESMGITPDSATTFTLVEPADFPTTLTPFNTVTSSALVTVTFENPTTGTYLGALEIVSNDRRTTVAVGLKAVVSEEFQSASTIETWRRY